MWNFHIFHLSEVDLADQGPSLGPLRPTTGPTTGPTGGHLGVVKILCELRADTDKGATRYGASPLFTAAEYGHAEADKRGWDGGWGMGWDGGWHGTSFLVK